MGHINTYNIHDQSNLVALCKVCHFAYDNEEWVFVPKDMSEWAQRIRATPDVIEEYKSATAVEYRRFILDEEPVDPSDAFNDPHYKAAFEKEPIKTWEGEPGLVIVRQFHQPADPSAEVEELQEEYETLRKLWWKYKSPCSNESCPLCRGDQVEKKDEKEEGVADEKDDDDDNGDEDEDDDDDDGSVVGNDGESEEDASYDGSKHSEGKSKRQPDKADQRPRTKVKGAERDWLTSAPYDESVPLSHRYGYTFRNATSNSIIRTALSYRRKITT